MNDPTITTDQRATEDSTELLSTIRRWGQEMGFQAVGFTGVELSQHRDYLDKWLAAGYHGEMGWMASHGCLLYTSPSPRDGLLSRMPSSA